MKKITVLSTACGSMFMPGFFSCLKDNGERYIRIIGVDIVENPFMGKMIDRYYKVKSFTSDSYIDELINICKTEQVDILFPHISMELPIVMERLDDFRKIGVKVAITDSPSLYIANNKLKLYDYMKRIGLQTPNYYIVKNSDDLLRGAEKLGYPSNPVVVKATESSGSRGVRIVNDRISLATAFLNKKPSSLEISMDNMRRTIDDCSPLPDVIVMEYLPGCEYTVDLLADRGETLYIAGRRNYESSMSIAMATVTEERETAYNMCREIVASLKLDGNIGFDFMLDADDKPVLTDLNPRVTATIVLYKEAGLNFPYLRVKQLMKEELPKVDVRYGLHMKRRYLDMFE